MRAVPAAPSPGQVQAVRGAVRPIRFRQIPQPRVSVDATPGLALAGDRIEVLALVANEHRRPLHGLWLGLVLPASAKIGAVVPPTGSAALSGLIADRVVLRCPLPALAPGASAGLDVEVLAPPTSGRFGLTAFVTVDIDPALTLTATRVLPVL